jgi:hypothetical protein
LICFIGVHELASEINSRSEIYQHWHDVYWDEFIPFAHGVRLFDEFYNDTLNPFDPAEFILLLNSSPVFNSTPQNLAKNKQRVMCKSLILSLCS